MRASASISSGHQGSRNSTTTENYAGAKKNKKKHSNCTFRSCDLRVMSPAENMLVGVLQMEWSIETYRASTAPNCFEVLKHLSPIPYYIGTILFCRLWSNYQRLSFVGLWNRTLTVMPGATSTLVHSMHFFLVCLVHSSVVSCPDVSHSPDETKEYRQFTEHGLSVDLIVSEIVVVGEIASLRDYPQLQFQYAKSQVPEILTSCSCNCRIVTIRFSQLPTLLAHHSVPATHGKRLTTKAMHLHPSLYFVLRASACMHQDPVPTKLIPCQPTILTMPPTKRL